ncbi:MAG: ATP-binding cassette domain-containing protein, partial [Bacillales bacterium]|nr:ATP-binding cassette domain-containing protein [Bacillales bacterium]
MRILEISKLKKEFPNKLLFSDLSFTLNDKERIGLLGLNGVGKTTLLKMVLGQEEKDAGLITLSPNISVGYL